MTKDQISDHVLLKFSIFRLDDTPADVSQT